MSDLNLEQLSQNQRLILEHALTHNDGRVTWFPDHIKGGAQAKVVGALAHKGFVMQTEAGWMVSEAARAVLGTASDAPTVAPAATDAVEDVGAEASGGANLAALPPAVAELEQPVAPVSQPVAPLLPVDDVGGLRTMRALAAGLAALQITQPFEEITLQATAFTAALAAAYAAGQRDGGPFGTKAASGSREPRVNKKAVMIEMLQRPGGASVAELMTATGWQQHSVRGALANLRNLDKLPVDSRKDGDTRYYFIADQADARDDDEATEPVRPAAAPVRPAAAPIDTANTAQNAA